MRRLAVRRDRYLFKFYLVFALMMLIATRLRQAMSAERAFYLVLIPAAAFADLLVVCLGPLRGSGLFVVGPGGSAGPAALASGGVTFIVAIRAVLVQSRPCRRPVME